MLDKAIVPELTGAMESIATHMQCFEGQGLCSVQSWGRLTHTHTNAHTQSISKLHPNGRMVQWRAANSTSPNGIQPVKAKHTR